MWHQRWLATGVLVGVLLLVPARAARPDSPTRCGLQPASLGRSADLVGFVGTNHQYQVPAGVNSVSGGSAVHGYPAWFPVAMDNFSSSAVSDPTITISGGVDPSVFDGTLPSPGLPSSCSQPGLSPGQELQLLPGSGPSPGQGSSFLTARGEQESFALGFDSTRSVTPSAVPVGGGDVTVQFAVTITDPRFAGGTNGAPTIGVNFQPNPGTAAILALHDPGNLDAGETVQDNSFNTWVLQNAQLDKTYVFTAVVQVANPLNGSWTGQAGPWTWVPNAQITVTEPGTDTCTAGPSVRVAEPDLDGSASGSGAITLSVADGSHTWCVGRQASWIADYPGGLFPDVSAQVNAAIGTGVPANVNDIASATTLTGQRNWFALGIGSTGPVPNTVGDENPTVSVASGYDPSLLDPGFGPPASSLPIVFSGQSALNLPQNEGGPGIGSTIEASFQSPCDISRSVAPLTIPVAGGHQTVTYSIRCTGIDSLNVGIGLGVPGASIVSFAPPTNLGQGEQLLAPGLPSNGGGGFGLNGVQPGKLYTFSFVLSVPNPYGVPFTDTPDLKSVIGETQPTGCQGCGGLHTSVTIAEPTLDGPTSGAGSVTFSLSDPHIWNIAVSHGYEINLGGTQPGTLSYTGPAGASDGQPVTLDAASDALDGTPVTFTLGAQSCTGTTANGGASCTISLAQPVGSYTLTVSSPGDVSVYPTQTYATFAITGPTATAQCKGNGWTVFGIFKNQGDCVSYVATGGKNPPNG